MTYKLAINSQFACSCSGVKNQIISYYKKYNLIIENLGPKVSCLNCKYEVELKQHTDGMFECIQTASKHQA